MKDFDIKNEYGSLYIEPRGLKNEKGILIYAEFEDVKGMPPNHIALNPIETMNLIKWLVGYINDIAVDEVQK